MSNQSPTPTLDAAWDSLLTSPSRQARRAPVPPAIAEALADVMYFHDQGLADDAMAMLDELRRDHPGEPSLVIAPWDQSDEEPAVVRATEGPAIDSDWAPDEEDILQALDLLDGYDETQDTEIEAANDSRPIETVPAVEEAGAAATPAKNGFHEAITVIEKPVPLALALALAPSGAIPTTAAYDPVPTHDPAPDSLLMPIDAVDLAADWFDDAIATLDALEADSRSVDAAAQEEEADDEWEIDMEEDDAWDEEIDIDTAEFDAVPLESPSPAETLAYLPQDLAAIRRGPSVTDTLPYSEDDCPRPLQIIPGGVC